MRSISTISTVKRLRKTLWRSSDAAAAEKGGYEHFMLKEIHEQPKAVQDTIGAYVKEGHIDFLRQGLQMRSWLLLRESISSPAVLLTMLVWLANM